MYKRLRLVGQIMFLRDYKAIIPVMVVDRDY